MITVGIDLAAQPKGTAVCEIEWTVGRADVRSIRVGADDEVLLRAFGAGEKVGIDAPFGWPDAFVEAVAAHREGRRWPEEPDDCRESLRLRHTDLQVHQQTGIWPLSVSANLIAIPAMRLGRLMSRYNETGGSVPRDGSGRLVEVYPAAALTIWELPATGYKGKKDQAQRLELAERLLKTAPWLNAHEGHWALCRQRDDALDAVVAAIIARTVAVGQCQPIPPDLRESARREGWIALPLPGSLGLVAAL